MFTCLTEKPFQFCEIWKQSLVKHFCLSLKSDMVFSLPNLDENTEQHNFHRFKEPFKGAKAN